MTIFFYISLKYEYQFMLESNRNSNILVYFLSVIFLFYISFLICAKIYSPFWFHQPVYHIYEIYPKISFSKEPYWKRKRLPTNGIFCDTKHIVTIPTVEIKDVTWETILHLIQGHYVDPDFVLNHITLPGFKDKLYADSYISCYYENIVKEVKPTVFIETADIEHLFGVLASRPVQIRFSKYVEKNCMIHDLLLTCVHEKYKKKNLSRNLIQTHIYQHSLRQGKTSGYVFQKHVDLCKAIIPLVQYQTFTFVLRDTTIHKLPRNYSIRCLNKSHIDLWRGIYMQLLLQFEVSIMPDFQYTLDWFLQDRYTIYVTVYTEEKIEHVHGIYVLEKTNMSWENENLEKPHMLRLAASMNFGRMHTHDIQHVLFFRGFLNCLNSYLLDRKDIGILEIPCISDNDLILSKWQEKYELRNVMQSAYYLYNLIYPNSPIQTNQFILL